MNLHNHSNIFPLFNTPSDDMFSSNTESSNINSPNNNELSNPNTLNNPDTLTNDPNTIINNPNTIINAPNTIINNPNTIINNPNTIIHNSKNKEDITESFKENIPYIENNLENMDILDSFRTRYIENNSNSPDMTFQQSILGILIAGLLQLFFHETFPPTFFLLSFSQLLSRIQFFFSPIDISFQKIRFIIPRFIFDLLLFGFKYIFHFQSIPISILSFSYLSCFESLLIISPVITSCIEKWPPNLYFLDGFSGITSLVSFSLLVVRYFLIFTTISEIVSRLLMPHHLTSFIPLSYIPYSSDLDSLQKFTRIIENPHIRTFLGIRFLFRLLIVYLIGFLCDLFSKNLKIAIFRIWVFIGVFLSVFFDHILFDICFSLPILFTFGRGMIDQTKVLISRFLLKQSPKLN